MRIHLKQSTFIFGILLILVSSCVPVSTEIASPIPTETHLSIPTNTKSPTATTLPTPTLSLPVGHLTAVPSSRTKISAENVQDLQEIARYYGDIDYFARVTKDNKFLFILDPDGLTKYEYRSMNKLIDISLANRVSDLQISNDGNWVLADNKWLLGLRDDKEPKIYNLSEEIDLLHLYPTNFSLSPDGSMVAVQQVRCYDLCNHQLQIVGTTDFQVLYITSGVRNESVPVFSPNGRYFAVADAVIESHPDGSTNRTGASVSIWTTNDFTRIASFSVKFPFSVTDIAFSEESDLIAIAQENAIDIVDTLGGNLIATIANLCASYQRKAIFAPSSPLKILESSDCGSSIWTISGNSTKLLSDSAPDLSKIVFDEEGNLETIPYPYSVISNLKAYRQEYYFGFLNDDIISFKTFDVKTLDRYSCDLSLSNSALYCQSHAPEISGGQVLGKDIILATDGQYYSYTVNHDRVDIYSSENPIQAYYSMPFRNYAFDLVALDPVNSIIFYQISLNVRINRVIIQDMKTNRILAKWEGETFLSSIAFSGSKKYVALCRTIGYNNRLNKDKLIIFDLAEKKIIYNETFTCSNASLALTQDGSKVAIEYYYLRNLQDSLYSSRVVVFNTLPPYDKKYIDVESSSHAIAFSNDDAFLAVTCTESDICFYDTANNNKLHQLTAHSYITNLAFSPDGGSFATSSSWGLISLWAVPPFANNPNRTQF